MRTFDWYSKSMTLDELEQPLCSLVSFTSYVIGTSYEKLIDPYYQEQRCNATTLVSVKVAGVPWREGINQQWGNRKPRFSDATYSVPWEMRVNIITKY